ncbi:MAG TPA: hypothetical protein VFB61_17290, partial [Gemmatimonadales bacterium]|nr:hypothetical protein [Gemmatimonadales bacterium]
MRPTESVCHRNLRHPRTQAVAPRGGPPQGVDAWRIEKGADLAAVADKVEEAGRRAAVGVAAVAQAGREAVARAAAVAVAVVPVDQAAVRVAAEAVVRVGRAAAVAQVV